MSKKLCLRWNDFQENIISAFGRLRDDKDFTDVTLVCEDGHQLEAHKLVLIASSTVFEKILQKNIHPRPLIYFRGVRSEDLVAILDFLYFGEANVYQETLDSFLAIAGELKLKGLTGKTLTDIFQEEEEEKASIAKPAVHSKALLAKHATYTNTGRNDPVPDHSTESVQANTGQISGDLQALDEKVKSVMEKKAKTWSQREQAVGNLSWQKLLFAKCVEKKTWAIT